MRAVACIVVVLLSSLAVAQASGAPVAILISVETSEPLPQLQPKDFVVSDNGQPNRPVHSVRPATELPLHIAILLDQSGSSQGARLLLEEYKHALAMAAALLREGKDQAAVFGLDDEDPEVHVRFTADRNVLVKEGSKVGRLHGGSAVFDSVQQICSVGFPKEPWPARRVALLISDLEDNASTRSFKDALFTCQAAGVMVVVLDPAQPGRDRLTRVAKVQMEQLAEATGGRVLAPKAATEIPAAIDLAHRLIASQHLLTFDPAPPDKHGQHRLKIRATAGNVLVRYPADFYERRR